MTKILVVGDCHVSDNQKLRRFDWLGSFILDTKPDHVVLMGDFLTMNCLSAWDKNKRMNMENRRYYKEIEAGRDAIRRMLMPMDEYNKDKKKSKKKQYLPELIYLEGNHEERLTRYLEQDPCFAGHVSIADDLNLKSSGIAWVPYRQYHSIHGVYFTHIPFNKIKPITGIDICRKASDVTVLPVVFGHTHAFNTSTFKRHGQKDPQQVLNCGCFFEEQHDEEYADGRVKDYWRGVIQMDLFAHGRYDLRTINIDRLEMRYGK